MRTYANRYVVQINWNGIEMLFLVSTDEKLDFVKQVIKETQDEYNLDGPCDLMDCVCDDYDMEWTDIYPDVIYDMYVR